MSDLIKKVYQEFKVRFKNEPLLVESPGRVNLIGDHTDYNDGFVLPAAIQKKIVMGVSQNNLNKIRAFSMDMNEFVIMDVQNLTKNKKHWANYIKGVAYELQSDGYKVPGFDLVFSGDIPIGAGMSSSAALEGAILVSLDKILTLNLSKERMARIGQQTEHKHVGVNCGIMDQFVNLQGKRNTALKLDCRSLEFELIPFERDDIKIVLCNSKVSHNLASSEYNLRRAQCEKGVQVLKKSNSEIESLRDVTFELLCAHKHELDAEVFARCKFVLDENERVQNASMHLKKGDFKSFGQSMYESHEGLSKDYEVSCYELDLLVELARDKKGVYGARMMGGGFGGCTVNLVQEEHVNKFKEEIESDYFSKTEIHPDIYITQINSGTKIINPAFTAEAELEQTK